MHHRYYSPRLGHFLTPDFRAPDIYDPTTVKQPYAYAAGNPVLFWDPDGLAWFLFYNRETVTEEYFWVPNDKVDQFLSGHIYSMLEAEGGVEFVSADHISFIEKLGGDPEKLIYEIKGDPFLVYESDDMTSINIETFSYVHPLLCPACDFDDLYVMTKQKSEDYISHGGLAEPYIGPEMFLSAPARGAKLTTRFWPKSSSRLAAKVGKVVIDPVVDNNILVRAWQAARRGSTDALDKNALELLQNTTYEWIVTPTVYKEFVKKLPRGSASRMRFLKSFKNVTVLTQEAYVLRNGAKFAEVFINLRKIANKSKQGLGDRALPLGGNKHTHFNDIVNAAFAKELGIPFVTADKRFLNFLMNHGKKLGVDGRHLNNP